MTVQSTFESVRNQRDYWREEAIKAQNAADNANAAYQNLLGDWYKQFVSLSDFVDGRKSPQTVRNEYLEEVK